MKPTLLYSLLFIFLSYLGAAQSFESPEEILFTAIFEQDLFKVEAALGLGAEIDSRYTYSRYAEDCFYWTPMMAACAMGQLDIVRLLQDNGASLWTPLAEGWSNAGPLSQKGSRPLHVAAAYGSVEVAEFLLQRGALVNAGPKHYTPLYYALQAPKAERQALIELLIAYGADYRQPGILAEAIAQEEIGWAQKWLRKQLVATATRPNCKGACTPLELAIQKEANVLLPMFKQRGLDLQASPTAPSLLEQAFLAQNLFAFQWLYRQGLRPTSDLIDLAKNSSSTWQKILQDGQLEAEDQQFVQLLKDPIFHDIELTEKPLQNMQWRSLSGGVISLYQFKGEWLLIVPWASWCESCKEQLLSLHKLQKKQNHWQVLVLSLDPKPYPLEDFIKAEKLPFIAAHDPTLNSIKAWDWRAPELILMDPQAWQRSRSKKALDWHKKPLSRFLRLQKKRYPATP